MKKALLIILLIISHLTIKSQYLSPNSQISLITCNPGNQLYSVFGHSAIRVKDSENGIDKVYNYGTFDFNTPNFYLKFARGNLNYQLMVSSMSSFLREYKRTNRSVFEQVIILSEDEKNSIYNFLEYNAQPENKFYQYDFFFDNCATRIRDVFKKEFKDDLKFNNNDYNSQTFREMILPYLEPHRWSRFGINLVLGQVADKQAYLQASMFLPDYLKSAFAAAKLNGKSLSEPIKVLFEQSKSDNKTNFLISPVVVFSLMFLLFALSSYFEIKNKKRFKLLDFLLFLSVGTVGLIQFLLWFATDHAPAMQNWNLIWALPFNFFITFWLFRKRKCLWLKYYFLLVSISAFAVLPCWFIIPQHLDFAIIPILFTIVLRSFNIFKYY